MKKQNINLPDHKIQEIVLATIRDKLGIEEIDIKASFTNDLGADSLDGIEIIMDLEKKLNIEINDEDAEEMKTVSDLLNYLRPLKEERRLKLKQIDENG